MNFYYSNEQRQPVGPVSEIQLHDLAKNGWILPGTPIIREGQSEWQTYQSIIPAQSYLPPPVPPQLIFQPAAPAIPAPKSSGVLKKGCLGLVAIFAFFVIGIPILSGIFGGISKVNNSPKTINQNTSVASDTPATPSHSTPSQYKIGQKFRLGDFSYTITAAFRTTHIAESDADGAFLSAFNSQMQAKLGAKEKEDEGAFLVVRYKIRNEGVESDVVSTTDFTVRDSKNRKFQPSSEATEALVNLQGAEFLLSEIQPGLSKEGVQAFTLPNEAFDGKLMLHVPEKSLFSSNEIIVNLNL